MTQFKNNYLVIKNWLIIIIYFKLGVSENCNISSESLGSRQINILFKGEIIIYGYKENCIENIKILKFIIAAALIILCWS